MGSRSINFVIDIGFIYRRIVLKHFIIIKILLVGILMAGNFNIFPIPQKIDIAEGYFKLEKQLNIYLRNTSRDENIGLEILEETLRNVGVKEVNYVGFNDSPEILIIIDNTNNKKLNIGNVEFAFSSKMLGEGYFINVEPDRIIVLSKTRRGLYYSLLTLSQIIGQFKDKIICCRIEDFPDFPWRAISDDISRGQVSTIENLKKIIRQLSFMKYNKYMLYIEDVFTFKNFPDIGQGRGVLTPDEVDELETYAKRYFIDIVPIFQTLGHYENILTQEKYMHYAEYPGAASIKISSKKAHNFVFKLLDDVTDAFDSEYFHMGADESWDVGLGESKEYIDKVGLERAYGEYYTKVYKYLKNRGKKVLMYGDVLIHHPEIFKYLPEDIIIVDWNYSLIDRYYSLDVLNENNRKYIVCAGLYNWVNPVPNFYFAWLNISNYFRQAHRKGAMGAIVSSWGDYGAPNLRGQNYLGYYYGAQIMWNEKEAKFFKVNRQFANHFLGIYNYDNEFSHLILFLSQIPQLSNFLYTWSYPFYESEPDLYLKSEILKTISEISTQIIDSLKKECALNEDYIEYLKMGCDFAEYSIKKMRVSIGVDNILRIAVGGKKPDAELIKSVLNDIDEAVSCLQKVKDKFVSLWIKNNRRDNLNLVTNLFDRQKAYMEYAKDELKGGELNIRREIESKWITGDTTRIKDPQSEIIFLKEFYVENFDNVERVDLQIMANTYGEAFINFKKVATVFATKSLSLKVENMRVWWNDVKRHIKRGNNTIVIKAKSYKPEFPSSVNVFIRVKYTNGKEKVILSDETWKCTDDLIKEIKDIDNVETMHNVTIYREYPWRISPPIFDYGFPSMIEF